MRRYLLALLVCTTFVSLLCLMNLFQEPEGTPVQVPPGPVHFVGTVQFDQISIRMIILKHSIENIADIDANEAVEAINVASARGLKIKDIGNMYFDKNGPVQRASVQRVKLSELQQFISKQMKVDAVAGDTFMIYTIGHGSGSGYLDNIGQRKILFDAFSNAAIENEQETFWWQLSCHAAAELPSISSLPPEGQQNFSMIASSPANEVSYFRTQGAQLEKVFCALAEDSPDIDPNQDSYIMAKELKDFLNNKVKQGRGDLLYASGPEEVIFGFNLARSIPIVDHNNPQGQYPRDYIPMPKK